LKSACYLFYNRTMKNVLDFIQFAVSHADPKTVPQNAQIEFPVGDHGVWEYLWGTKGQVCTQKLLNDRYNSYYSRNGWTLQEYESATRGWVADKTHVTDCQGLLDAYLGNNINADGNYRSYCTDKGLISAISRKFVVGEVVFNGTDQKKTHVGWVCGFVGSDPLIVEAQGLKYGVVITRLSKRKFKYRGLMTKKFSYSEPVPQPDPAVYVFTRPLKKGDVGDDVVKLKHLLINAGYRDGITTNTENSKNFGNNTRKMVKDFQRDTGLTVDGIAGEKTIIALGGVYR